MKLPVILTGLRVNNDFTLGNYLGAIKPMINLSKKHAKTHQINMFVPDLHTITTEINYNNLQQYIFNGLKDYVASGLDIENKNIYIYRQSYIPAHSELTWILDCFTGYGEANRMVEFKNKSTQIGLDRVSVGLFNYPILMSSDILLYDALWVPVGEDQRQHIELTRNIAQRFNNKFGNIFTVPKSPLEQAYFSANHNPLRIRSLRNPNKKMSKSISDPAGTITLSDNPSDAAKKIMSATTDELSNIDLNWDVQPGISNLIQIYAGITNTEVTQILKEWQGKKSYGDFKKVIASSVKTFLTDFQAKRANVNESAIINKLIKSEPFIQKQANAKLLKVQKAVGLR